MPNEKEIKDVLNKAKKIAESKKLDKKPDKKLDKKVDKPKTPPTTEEPSSSGEAANAQLLNAIKELQRSVVTLQKNQETLNNAYQSLISKNSPSQTKKTSDKSETEENNKNKKEEEKLTPEEKLARAQEEQARRQAQEEQARKEALERGLQERGIKPVIHPQVLYLIDTILKTTGPIVQQALTKGGGEGSSGIAPMIENFKTFGELSKVFSQIQSNIAKGYSDSLKAMSPPVRQEMADQMLKGSSVPETSPSERGHIR